MLLSGRVALKKCNKCLIEKNLNEFFADKSHSTGRYSICKVCKNESTYKWRREKRDKYNNGARIWRSKNKNWCRLYRIKRVYGLSREKYYEMFDQQNNCCAICGISQGKSKRLFSIDHDHSTGIIRELLCSNCNKGLGSFQESVDLLSKASAYLEEHRRNPGIFKVRTGISPWGKKRI